MSTTSTTSAEQTTSYRSQCWDNAIHAFGTSYVFQQRARRLKIRLQWINYVGIAVPILAGSLVLSFGQFGPLSIVVTILSAIGVIQVIVNLWSLVGRWVEEHSYTISSIASNDSLSIKYREFGQNPPAKLSDLRQMYERLQVEDRTRREQDHQHGISDSERRMGMRAALRQFQRTCVGCKKVPTSMEPSDCGICGNFKYVDR
jgi:mobilome CxxCx(11)CxxC protein